MEDYSGIVDVIRGAIGHQKARLKKLWKEGYGYGDLDEEKFGFLIAENGFIGETVGKSFDGLITKSTSVGLGDSEKKNARKEIFEFLNGKSEDSEQEEKISDFFDFFSKEEDRYKLRQDIALKQLANFLVAVRQHYGKEGDPEYTHSSSARFGLVRLATVLANGLNQMKFWRFLKNKKGRIQEGEKIKEENKARNLQIRLKKMSRAMDLMEEKAYKEASRYLPKDELERLNINTRSRESNALKKFEEAYQKSLSGGYFSRVLKESERGTKKLSRESEETRLKRSSEKLTLSIKKTGDIAEKSDKIKRKEESYDSLLKQRNSAVEALKTFENEQKAKDVPVKGEWVKEMKDPGDIRGKMRVGLQEMLGVGKRRFQTKNLADKYADLKKEAEKAENLFKNAQRTLTKTHGDVSDAEAKHIKRGKSVIKRNIESLEKRQKMLETYLGQKVLLGADRDRVEYKGEKVVDTLASIENELLSYKDLMVKYGKAKVALKEYHKTGKDEAKTRNKEDTATNAAWGKRPTFGKTSDDKLDLSRDDSDLTVRKDDIEKEYQEILDKKQKGMTFSSDYFGTFLGKYLKRNASTEKTEEKSVSTSEKSVERKKTDSIKSSSGTEEDENDEWDEDEEKHADESTEKELENLTEKSQGELSESLLVELEVELNKKYTATDRFYINGNVKNYRDSAGVVKGEEFLKNMVYVVKNVDKDQDIKNITGSNEEKYTLLALLTAPWETNNIAYLADYVKSVKDWKTTELEPKKSPVAVAAKRPSVNKGPGTGGVR